MRFSLLASLGLPVVSCGIAEHSAEGHEAPPSVPGDVPGDVPTDAPADVPAVELPECTRPLELTSGFVLCGEGFEHRPRADDCSDAPSPDPAGCDTSRPGTRCCATDADCTKGAYCQCDVSGGSCSFAGECVIDSDCASGMCVFTRSSPGGARQAFCVDPEDECVVDADCKSGWVCSGAPINRRVCRDVLPSPVSQPTGPMPP